MQQVPCNACGANEFSHLFSKASSRNEIFRIVTCRKCGLVQVNPQPSEKEVAVYYANDYFTKRTDRGYDNYYSDTLRKEISRVFQLNLADLGFGIGTTQNKKSLDIGCAAGYFVDFMRNSGWDAAGIEIAKHPAEFAKKKLGLNIIQKNFLDWDEPAKNKFDLITLWATIEHLHMPLQTLKKAYSHLRPGGVLIVSTCRYGLLSRIMGVNWRYMNVPEHLYYFSLPGLVRLGKMAGFAKKSHVTYGSGFTSRKNSGMLYNSSKKFMDWLVKKTGQGDMMAVLFIKE